MPTNWIICVHLESPNLLDWLLINFIRLRTTKTLKGLHIGDALLLGNSKAIAVSWVIPVGKNSANLSTYADGKPTIILVLPAWLSRTGHRTGATTSEPHMCWDTAPPSAALVVDSPLPYPGNVIIIYICQERLGKRLCSSEVKFSLMTINI